MLKGIVPSKMKELIEELKIKELPSPAHTYNGSEYIDQNQAFFKKKKHTKVS